jgi:hypothetical protein
MYANQEELECRLGSPTYVSVGKGGLKRILNFEKYNLVEQGGHPLDYFTAAMTAVNAHLSPRFSWPWKS